MPRKEVCFCIYIDKNICVCIYNIYIYIYSIYSIYKYKYYIYIYRYLWNLAKHLSLFDSRFQKPRILSSPGAETRNTQRVLSTCIVECRVSMLGMTIDYYDLGRYLPQQYLRPLKPKPQTLSQRFAPLRPEAERLLCRMSVFCLSERGLTKLGSTWGGGGGGGGGHTIRAILRV